VEVIRSVARAAALLSAALLTACGGSSSPTAALQCDKVPSQLHGARTDTAAPKPTFTLADTDDASYDFKARTAGKVTFLYFGYTHCPDECPTSMADVASALRRLPAATADQVAVVFVTTDPWRDTPAVLRKWLDRFDPDFVGLTGNPTDIAGAEVDMGLPISKRQPAKRKDGVGRYSVAHFAAVLAYGRDGRLATLYPAGVTPTDIAADIQVLVKGCKST
jgi:protein SCO1/2